MASTNVLLDAIERTAASTPDAPAFRSAEEPATTYSQMWHNACVIAHGLASIPGRGPVLVLGPKRALTVECLLACLMSGHAYVPLDVELPPKRFADIAGQIRGATLLTACDAPDALATALPDARVLDARELLGAHATAEPLPREMWVTGEQTQYIIFTSGSTGRPKGIEVTENDVANFRRWLAYFPVVREGGRVFLDQAHYSFDLSEFEIVGALTTGGCLHAVDASELADYRRLFADLGNSGIEVWVSTPSFADACLADPSFSATLLPHLCLFLFCGEALHHTTAAKLRERFPDAIVANTYGPTESTVAVTYCEITDEMLADPAPLPVGRPRQGTELAIVDHTTGAPVAPGQTGEVIIRGDTVALDYYENPEKTAEAFFETSLADGTQTRGYRTGDLGFIDEDGLLHVQGRLDSLVKLNGFRIELGEVEGALEEISRVRHAVVVPATRAGRVTSLCAFVVVGPDAAGPDVATNGDAFATARSLKAELAMSLPAYMVPRQIRILDEMPLNANGKADRKTLAARVSR
ncbi:amino acid adenylation domain-containing protein [Parolsenella catena]|uniref:amino acid adenylation domain-containing protein n=1 Tax=Parolsenella catena TaxID=2003188 RepID=UPI0018972E1B|nr:amino acid adenylation domain-containing protein [Parolsenella catena]